jgi:pimeloyl-ACP methyl ester carboxylesterase
LERCIHYRLKIIPLILILGMIACNYPGVHLMKSYPSAELTTEPSQAPGQPTNGVSSTPLQPDTITPSPLPPTETASPSPTPPASYQPVFEPAECAFPVPEGTNPECGYLVVPENRARPDGKQVRLHVAIFHSRSANPNPDPVVHLSGGPGASALALSGYLFHTGLDKILDSRDLVIFDQRGTGYSQPSLNCPERQAITPQLLDGSLSKAEEDRLIVDVFQRCHDRLSAQGIDLSAYTSAASAADVEDLRRVLGYPQLNLHSVSYGTRLALTVMRDDPQGVRSVVLDSTLPLQVNLYTALAPNAARAFKVLFDRCAADRACSQAYPDLETSFYNLVDQLNANPLMVNVQANGSVYPVRVDGDLLVDVLFTGLYNPSVISYMPKMISDIQQGNTAILKERLGLYFDTSTALGLQMSMICAEEIPFSSPEEAFDLAQGTPPQIANFFPASVQPLFTACQAWGADPDLRENLPVTSNVPALVLGGEFDPITPPSWGRMAVENLSQAYFYEFPANGHWVTRSSGCAISMMLAFLEEPDTPPDSGCIAKIGGIDFAR